MGIYYDFPSSDTSSIAVAFEQYQNPEEVELHMHHHYEFTLVNRGTCIHKFRGVEVPLIAGDVFLIPPDEEHGYSLDSNSAITNCYFFPERLGQFSEYVKTGTFQQSEIPFGLEDIKNQWDSLLSTITLRSDAILEEPLLVTDNMTKQGVLHLAPAEAMDVESLLVRIHEEHLNLEYDSEYMKSAILQMILVIFKRAKNNQPQRLPKQPERKKQMIIDSLIFLENHYPESLTVSDIAAASSLSESYFRNIFKEVTGLAPLDYLNRIRVIKALEYLQSEDLPISEAAAKVGIIDSNYFTRVFKKVMGYPPRYFKKIPRQTAEQPTSDKKV